MTATGGSRLLRSSGVVALGTALSRVTGLVRTVVIVYALGTTALAEAYNLANTTPNLLYDLVLGGILAATLVPVVVQQLDHDDTDSINALATVVTVVLGVTTVVAMLAAPLIIRAYNLTESGDEAARQAEVAVPLLVLFIPQMFFYGLTALGSAILNAKRYFAVPAFAPVLNNIVVICLFLALPSLAGGDQPTFEQVRDDRGLQFLLGLGTTAGIVAMTLVLWPALRYAGVRLRWRFDLRDPAVRQVGRLSGWTLGYVVANQVAFFTMIVLANGVDGVTVYTTAYIFFQLPYGLWAVSVMTAFTPEMAAAAVAEEWDRLRARFTYGLRLVLVLMLPAAVGMALLAGPGVELVLERGALDAASSDTIATTLAALAVGLPFFSAYLFAMRGFYALRDTRTPFVVNVGENVLTIVLAVALVGPFGVEGLAAAFSGGYVVFSVVALVVLQRRIGPWFDRSTARGIVRLAAATTVMALVVGGVLWGLGTGLAASVLAGLAGSAAYVVVLLALRAEELRAVTDRLRRTDRRAAERSG
ncbi:MAG: murein biosynthesis integral membrane protein MurJ [Acidimicrobiales bacterium]|jgi:putative peptidoglycan lipid II flippase|nr:murein biosynthesis integral membrane protein MurJ [Acidimicrobiales bacterium]